MLTKLYWDFGNMILEKGRGSVWGSNIVEKLAKDLAKEFPSVQGFVKRNFYYMRQFAEAYVRIDGELEVFTKIPWGHNLVMLNKLKGIQERIWYARKTVQNGWSRSSLVFWIESDLYNREGKAISNFEKALPQQESDVAQELLKDPYRFEFLTRRRRS